MGPKWTYTYSLCFCHIISIISSKVHVINTNKKKSKKIFCKNFRKWSTICKLCKKKKNKINKTTKAAIWYDPHDEPENIFDVSVAIVQRMDFPCVICK